MSLKIESSQSFENIESQITELKNFWLDFLAKHERKEIFLGQDLNYDFRKKLIEKYNSKKNFVHVGLGGSSLGPQFLVEALNQSNKNFCFINNLDPDEINDQLKKISLKNSLFYIVSKSGETIETLAILNIIDERLTKELGADYDKSDFFVFCTDPKKGYLNSLAQEWEVSTLEIHENVGGRFSAFTDVSYFPLEFSGVDTKDIKNLKEKYSQDIANKKELFSLADNLYNLSLKGINQTVFMPYSSKLKSLSLWFVQLWAESLGKIRSKDNKNVGLTPLFSYGATDQHSQVQLFMEGPKDKALIFLEVSKSNSSLKITKALNHPKMKLIESMEISEVLKAELYGTKQALTENKVPNFSFIIEEANLEHLVETIISLEALTILVAHKLEIDPFDQPGVELGKKLCLQYLKTN